jgi:hypothetical protein
MLINIWLLIYKVAMFLEPATGRVIMRKDLDVSADVMQFKTNNLSAGIYIITIAGNNLAPQYFKVVNIK